MTISKADHDAICRKLVDRGRLIEAGFEMLRFSAIADDAPMIQIEEMRMAFFAGAQHVFASIMSILEPGAEPTDNDLGRMTAIQTELDEFIEQFKLRYRATPGTIN